MRTSVGTGAGAPSGCTSFSCRTRRSFALQGRSHVANFVEEDRAPLRRLKQAPLVVTGIGERTSPVAEQLALQECLGDRRTIHGEKWAGRSRALLVQRPSQQLLSRPALAHQQDRRVAQRRAIDELHDRPHRAGLGQNPGQLFAARPGRLRVARRTPIGDRILERTRKLTKLDRSRRETPVRGRRASTNTRARLPVRRTTPPAGPVARREVHVGNHRVDIRACADLVGLGPARRRQDGVLRPKGLLQLTLHRFVVFDDEHSDN